MGNDPLGPNVTPETTAISYMYIWGEGGGWWHEPKYEPEHVVPPLMCLVCMRLRAAVLAAAAAGGVKFLLIINAPPLTSP